MQHPLSTDTPFPSRLDAAAINNLPKPSTDELAQSQQLQALIAQEIRASGGFIGFDRYMQSALYAPHLGYYSGPSAKFGSQGDFITAPLISPLFATALANQCLEWFEQVPPQLFEFGAGDGTLAAQLLMELGAQIERYTIIELSPQLRARQQGRLQVDCPNYVEKVVWVDQLPDYLNGVIIANEVLDAMPTHIFRLATDGVMELGVALDAVSERLTWSAQAADSTLKKSVEQLLLDQAQGTDYPVGYTSEICPQAAAWVASIATRMQRSAMLIIDYGFSSAQLYLPQRALGTLMCHYRHYAHGDALFLPGLQDITAHVDFTRLALAAQHNGLEVAGYATQANFLINCGILQAAQMLMRTDDAGAHEPLATNPSVEQTISHARMTQGLQKLISEAEMGELFKVLALTKGCEAPAIGFSRGDRRHQL